MVVSLQELLSQSVTQTMGLSEILERRRYEAEKLGQATLAQGMTDVARIQGEGKVGVAKYFGDERKKGGLFSSPKFIIKGDGGDFKTIPVSECIAD